MQGNIIIMKNKRLFSPVMTLQLIYMWPPILKSARILELLALVPTWHMLYGNWFLLGSEFLLGPEQRQHSNYPKNCRKVASFAV